jgi:hypothetical protein
LIDHEKQIFKTLIGKYKHYCIEWDGMAIDETFPEFEACLCYNDKNGAPLWKITGQS